ncbi:MAG TPA: DUF1003 domain-containing protein [Jatrophihabitantaceae bacterium]|nr:DUF1003 domain-containing protein [Jatrophihabitantaceae bacterium]HYU67130.1 DUF1003 domain-containing protein [Jatrophihabitantaceae bacterium]
MADRYERRERRERRDRLDQPRLPRGLRPPRIDADAFGEVSERIARYFGTARYLAIQTVFVIAWIAFNVAAVTLRFDPYPFILLNLAFSTQAAYAAPLILLAQNRQADRDRIQAEADRARDDRTIADTEYLAREIAAIRIAMGELVTRDFLRSELMRADGGREAD